MCAFHSTCSRTTPRYNIGRIDELLNYTNIYSWRREAHGALCRKGPSSTLPKPREWPEYDMDALDAAAQQLGQSAPSIQLGTEADNHMTLGYMMEMVS